MRLSYSLKKNILETYVGGIINKFKIRKRRDVLFFIDILAQYIKECEKAGYSKEMEEIGQKWMNLGIQQVVPEIFKKIPIFFLNKIMKKVWVNLGLVDDLHVIKKNNIIEIKTKNEGITRIIGKNSAMVGFYIGVLNVIFKSQIKCVKSLQIKKYCNYVFSIENKAFDNPPCKSKEDYNKLNFLSPIEGFTLKDALKKGIFHLKKDNRLYFRGKLIIPLENTGFHIVSNKGILLEKVSLISYKYFKEIIKEKTTKEEKLVLLKNLLQTMGWGLVNIIYHNDNKELLIEIKNPPYGLQLEKDKWDFLAQIILGYLWLLDRKFRIIDIKEDYKMLTIKFLN